MRILLGGVSNEVAREHWFYLHCTPLLDKSWLDFVLEIINLQREVHLWSSRLNGKLLAEGHPLPSKFSSL